MKQISLILILVFFTARIQASGIDNIYEGIVEGSEDLCSLEVSNFELSQGKNYASFDYRIEVENCEENLNSDMCKEKYVAGTIDFDDMVIYSDNKYSQSAYKVLYDGLFRELTLQIDFMAKGFFTEKVLRSFTYSYSKLALLPLGTETIEIVTCVVN